MSAKPETDPPKLAAKANVVRYVGGSQYDHATGVLNGEAFVRPQKDLDGMSFTQRLIFSTKSEDDKVEIRRVFASRMNVGKTAIFDELNVGRALAALTQFDDDFHFLADPLPAEGSKLANPAHALLIGLPFAGEAVGSLKSELAGDLLQKTVHDKFPAVLPQN